MHPWIAFTISTLLCFSCGIVKEPELVWADEFDYNGLPDSSRWDYEEGFIRNRELQFYTAKREKNARVEDGMLILEAYREDYIFDKTLTKKPNPLGSDTASCTSAALITLGKASWTYGRVEVRAKLPTGRGMWPAIWMLGTNRTEVGWPMCGEIDIMENVGFDPHNIYGNVHTKSYNHVIKTKKGDTIQVPEPYKEFHVYAIEWTRDSIGFFVDDEKELMTVFSPRKCTLIMCG